jgi:hypothetical protein
MVLVGALAAVERQVDRAAQAHQVKEITAALAQPLLHITAAAAAAVRAQLEEPERAQHLAQGALEAPAA